MKEEEKRKRIIPGVYGFTETVVYDSLDIACFILGILLWIFGYFTPGYSFYSFIYLPILGFVRMLFKTSGSKYITFQEKKDLLPEKRTETDLGLAICGFVTKAAFFACLSVVFIKIMPMSEETESIFKGLVNTTYQFVNLGVCMSFAFNVFLPCALMIESLVESKVEI